MRNFLAALLLLITGVTQAQDVEPVKWAYSVEETAPGEFDLIFTAKIDKGWHLYTTMANDMGPLPTTFKFRKSQDYTASGKIIEKGYHTVYDPMFDAKISSYDNKAVFRQHIKANREGKFKVKGELEYQVCNSSQCLPPTPEAFVFNVENKAAVAGSTASVQEPATWTFSSKDLGNGTFQITAEAIIEKGWHVYSSNLGPEAAKAGPQETKLTFEKGAELVGAITEPTPKEEFDPNFNLKLKFHDGKVTFTQVIKKTSNKSRIQGHLIYQVCNAELCMPGSENFGIDLSTGQQIDFTDAGESLNTIDPTVLALPNVDTKNPLGNCTAETETQEGKSLWTIFLLGFFGGLIALLTPCVFPMIPLTVTFFTKGSANRRKGIINACIYGGFIFVIYLLLSLPFHLVDSLDPEILNTISVNVWLNLAFFIIFIIFSISFLGYFEITLPSSLANSADTKSETGGLIGIFFMAVTLAIVSFSCTGPILGSLLVGSISSNGGAIQLSAGMGGFGLALALPFTVFALFPGMLKSLPKSGGWLNTVKVILGFVEIALAAKFLSTADLVGHWNFFKYEAFLGVWILAALGLALYFFGILKFPHDSPIKKLGAGRIISGLASIAFVAYLCTGFMYSEKNHGYKPLSLLSGLAPASSYCWAYPSDCPLNLACFHDYAEGMAYAKEVGKPVLLDFTGYGCTNCRRMEDEVWSKAEIFKMLSEDYVVISLYADDPKELPKEEQFEYKNARGKVKQIKTVGNKWATMEAETFNKVTQPYYALLSNDGRLLNNPVAYTPVVEEYKAFLECGLETFKKNSKGK